MAKNRVPEKHVEPESEEDSSEEIESESEPEQAQFTQKPSSSSALDKHQPQSQLSSSSDEEEEESDSESDPDLNVEPIASKPSDDAKKPRSKPTASETATPSKTQSIAKRPAEEKEVDVKDSKRSKKKLVSENESGSPALDSSKRVLFQRLWSEDDEIVILKGMLDYALKKKSNPIADPDAFLEFIKKNLHFDGNKTQLLDKVKRLKKKYEKNKGKNRNFSKPHEKEAYELSEKIWGNEKGKEIVVANGSVAVRKAPSKTIANGVENDLTNVGVANGDAMERVRSYCLNVDERVLSIGADLFEGVNGAEEGAKEWRKLMLDEMEINIKKMDVMRARTKLVLDFLKSANH
ncbi:hypothetical protein RD792_005013 [Penstemon davidsonii]|uniref:Glabrous enhancer-binding protein-like DBD domain-containing protein n=1 Tax=Penstemon davidsonii TaxID=160366 RepID=A0ABR0DKB8_9LAMI|nr:hypothetical protein RD792_005013 [Penstemon davidsonii]